MRSSSRRLSVISAAVLAAALLVGGCSVPPKVQSPAIEPTAERTTEAPTGTGEDVPEDLAKFYGQQLVWSQCGGAFECTTAIAPLSWEDPSAGQIELALKRLPASGERLGSLLTNPGGPGGSGVDFVTSTASHFGTTVREGYDIVGFDPRGVGLSTPVKCLDDERKDEALSKDFPTDDAGLAAMGEELKVWADACAANTGELLGHVDTQSAARDMDMLRAVLGDEKLNYLGFSYGTQLGATYAGLFPDKVGRMVLDGAIDTNLSVDEIGAQQAVGFENALRAYVTDCQSGAGCPLTGSLEDGLQQIRDLLDRTLEHPMETGDGRRLTQILTFYGIAVTLYAEQNWPALTGALALAINDNDGSGLLSLADFYNERNTDGTFASNSAEAFRAVSCMDDRGNPDMAVMKQQAAETIAAAPTMGQFFGYGGLTCKDWAYPAVEQKFDLHAKGAAPIVVIGTTNDPATPYTWAQGLAKTLDSAVLVTYEGEGHTAYTRSNDCIMNAVDQYLVAGKVPEDGLTC